MLALEEVIAESHDDFEVWSSVRVGFDNDKQLIVELKFINYERPEDNYNLYAIIEKEGAARMAGNLNIRLTSLPAALFKRFGEAANSFYPSEVEAIFKEILDFILDCGIHYRLERNYKFQ